MSPSPARASSAGTHGAVSAGHQLATDTALDCLRRGGNAVDAAVAASAVQTVVEFPWCGLGGDVFMMVHREGDSPVALNGSGIAPEHARSVVDGSRVPRFGPASVAVPGIAGSWEEAARRFGTMPLEELLAPAVAFAREGFRLDARHEASLEGLRGDLQDGWHLNRLLDGNGCRAGELFVQGDLGDALAEIAAKGANVLYRGELGARISAHLRDLGGAMTSRDLATFDPRWVAPLSLPYHGYTVLQHPPVSMGIIMLVELGLLRSSDVTALAEEPAALIDLMVRCKHVAFDATQGVVGDPDVVTFDPDEMLSPVQLEELLPRLGTVVEAGGSQPRAEGADTTSLAVVDVDGWTVTCIQSLFNEFGSRVLIPETGIVMNDRLANLEVDDGPRGLQPGRRPVHTLNAYQVLEGERCVLAGATPGGRGQVQTNFQVLVNVLDLGMSPQAAVDAPRWLSGTPRRPDDDRRLHLEHSYSAEVANKLRQRGHDVQISDPRDDDLFGCCTVVARDKTGRLLSTSDARRGSVAAAY